MDFAIPTSLSPLLTDLRAALYDLYGDRLVRLVLYGSFARGDFHDESDVDVLVVLKGPMRPVAEIRRMGRIRLEVGMRHERTISALPVSEAEYTIRESMLLQNVHAEGVVL